MHWSDLKQAVRQDLESRNLKDPRIRIGALERIDKLLGMVVGTGGARIDAIVSHDKSELVKKLSQVKSTGKLNSAEQSVLNDIYRFIRQGAATGITQGKVSFRPSSTVKSPKTDRQQSDEVYVIDLCDEILGIPASRQHTFDFLIGDAQPGRIGKKLPVDAYYDQLSLVVEYREQQHMESVAFFDKPERITVSGVNRGEQRRLYDERRRKVLPEYGIELIEISYTDLSHDRTKRLIRTPDADRVVIRGILSAWIPRS